MKHSILLLASLLALFSCKGENKEQNPTTEKKALLMVYFGTTNDQTRALTIDSLNKKAKEVSENTFEAYTSRIVIKRLKERGIEKETPTEILTRLNNDGYTHVTIVPTFIIPGKESKMLDEEVNGFREKFKEITVKTPLLCSVEDCDFVTDVIAERNKTNSPSHHVLFVGHGTDDPATAVYGQMDYMLKAKGFTNMHVATIEGYPTFETALQLLKKGNAKIVTLVPLMFVAGDHAVNDISKDWKEMLEKNGFKVELNIEGLGQIPEIQSYYLSR